MVINHAICSEMLVKRGVRQRWPWATTFVVGLTALLTIAQFMYPALLPAMERQTGMWRDHQYWRIVTPLFLHSDGWKQIALNFPVIICIGVVVEWIYGFRFWLISYFFSGIVGELFALVWQPTGAGASVAGAGLLGALTIFGLLRMTAPQVKFGAVFIMVGAIVLSAIRDIHCPPILTGACLGIIAMHWNSAIFTKSRRFKVPL